MKLATFPFRLIWNIIKTVVEMILGDLNLKKK